MALVARQTRAQRRLSLVNTLTAEANSISHADILELDTQDLINHQGVYGFMSAGGVPRTVTLNNATPSKVTFAAALGSGSIESTPLDFITPTPLPEIAVDVADDSLLFRVDALVKFTGSMLIEPPSSSSLILVDIRRFDASTGLENQLGFKLEAVQQAGKGTSITIPSFDFMVGAGDKFWLTATTDNGTAELCNIVSCFFGASIVPYGV